MVSREATSKQLHMLRNSPHMDLQKTKSKAVLLTAFLVVLLPLVRGQAKESGAPILEAREISGGCCQPSYDHTYLRVFPNGRAEWEQYDPAKNRYVLHHAVLSRKQLRAVDWAIASMKNLAKSYTAESAKGNIDSFYSFAITGSEKGKTYQTEIFFGLPVDAENYSELRVPVRTLACNVSVVRTRLANEEADLEFCKKYYVGW